MYIFLFSECGEFRGTLFSLACKQFFAFHLCNSEMLGSKINIIIFAVKYEDFNYNILLSYPRYF